LKIPLCLYFHLLGAPAEVQTPAVTKSPREKLTHFFVKKIRWQTLSPPSLSLGITRQEKHQQRRLALHAMASKAGMR